MSIAVYAGSFDPPTNGHAWMIQQAARMFDRLLVAVAVNPDKRYRFPAEQRIAMLASIIEGIEPANVTILEVGNEFLASWAEAQGASHLVRGIRSVGDFDYERTIRHFNEKIAPKLTTVFLMPPKALEDVSSSVVKGMVGPRGWRTHVAGMVPAPVLDAFLAEAARTRWQQLLARLPEQPGLPGDAWCESLLRAWTEPHRGYHCLSHLLACLEELEDWRASGEAIPASVDFALWYHDAVYDPAAGDNEAQSAKLAKRHLGGHFEPAFVDEVAGLVEGTAHLAGQATGDSTRDESRQRLQEVVNDIDFAILGRPPEEYAAYVEGVRREYGFVPAEAFRSGRAGVLRAFLERPSLFATGRMKARYEQQARKNLEAELTGLEGQELPAPGRRP